MKVAALVSGGKDSIYNIMKCLDHGHEVVCLVNLHPVDNVVDDLDSFMYQTVGHQHIKALAACLGLPLIRHPIHGRSHVQTLQYTPSPEDEVEDLLLALRRVQQQFPEVTAVGSGAILSNYQRLRVENVCSRLGLVSLAYLWQRDQDELLQEMVQRGVRAMLVKVAAMGLRRRHLGQTLNEVFEELIAADHIHSCGEGGEYETFVVDCPLFRRRMRVADGQAVMSEDNDIAPVGVWRFRCEVDGIDLESSGAEEDGKEALPPMTSPSPCLPPSPSTMPEAGGRPLVSRVGDFLFCGGLDITAISEDPAGGMSVEEEVHALMRFVQRGLADVGSSLHHVFFVHIHCRHMSDFVRINTAYSAYFSLQPPARATVGLQGLRSRVMMEVAAVTGAVASREALHVQSISEWAPACIGPYSQAYRMGRAVFFAGIIGLVPETMQLPENDPVAEQESALALCSLSRVARVMGTRCADAALLVLYVTDWSLVAHCRGLWDSEVGPQWAGLWRAIPVTALPRGCRVEWQMVATVDADDHHLPATTRSECAGPPGVIPAGRDVRLLSRETAGTDGLHLDQWLFAVEPACVASRATEAAVACVTQAYPGLAAGYLRWYFASDAAPEPDTSVMAKQPLRGWGVTVLPVPGARVGADGANWLVELLTVPPEDGCPGEGLAQRQPVLQ